MATVKIEQRFRGGKHAVGRFRISLTGSETPLPLGVSARVAELVALPAERRSPAQQAELVNLMLRQDPAFERAGKELAAAMLPLPRKPEIIAIEGELAEAEKPVPDDLGIVRLRSDVAVSTEQVADRRLTAIQDLAWALINSPAFFFNH